MLYPTELRARGHLRYTGPRSACWLLARTVSVPQAHDSGVARRRRERCVGGRLSSLSGLSILVVEDNYDARMVYRAVLRHFGAHVTVAAGVRAARAALRRTTPDVVIVDMFLGTETALTLIPETHDERRIPFIAVSAKTFFPEQLEFIGFAAYLCKPLDHWELVETILRVASHAGQTKPRRPKR
jgi:CheY-like chemotaxis protein